MTTTKVGSTITEPANKKARGPHSGPRILLGVTGSVAAVKAPEVVVQLVTQCKNAEVKVVLSRGGQTFWDKAADYDPESCKRLRELLKQVNENGNPSVEIHGKCQVYLVDYKKDCNISLQNTVFQTPTKNGRTGID
jgi:phosphopantothenoylcysteine synthetase/decarboxylase